MEFHSSHSPASAYCLQQLAVVEQHFNHLPACVDVHKGLHYLSQQYMGYFSPAGALLSPFQLKAGTFPFKVSNLKIKNHGEILLQSLLGQNPWIFQTPGPRFSSGVAGHGYCSSRSVWMQDTISCRDFRPYVASLARVLGGCVLPDPSRQGRMSCGGIFSQEKDGRRTS